MGIPLTPKYVFRLGRTYEQTGSRCARAGGHERSGQQRDSSMVGADALHTCLAAQLSAEDAGDAGDISTPLFFSSPPLCPFAFSKISTARDTLCIPCILSKKFNGRSSVMPCRMQATQGHTPHRMATNRTAARETSARMRPVSVRRSIAHATGLVAVDAECVTRKPIRSVCNVATARHFHSKGGGCPRSALAGTNAQPPSPTSIQAACHGERTGSRDAEQPSRPTDRSKRAGWFRRQTRGSPLAVGSLACW